MLPPTRAACASVDPLGIRPHEETGLSARPARRVKTTMSRLPKGYRSFQDFQREEIRPEMRIGWTVDEIETTGRELDFDMDPFEAALWAAESEESDD